MKIYTNKTKETEILSIEEWLKECPPKNIDSHWEPKRSAMEMAKFWTNIEKQSDFLDFMSKNESNIAFDYAIPELANKFDDYRSPRKTDLCVFGNQEGEKIFISIEGKADEPFGTYVKNIKGSDKSKSKKFDRINALNKRFGSNDNFLNLRYQLTYWFASAIDEAIRNEINKVYLIVQVFESDETEEKKIEKNEKDLNNFINFISKSKIDKVERNEIIGQFNNEFTKNLDLYIGKYHIMLP
jgi:hypothetical protein